MSVSAMGGLTHQIAYQQIGNQIGADTPENQAKSLDGSSDDQKSAGTQPAGTQVSGTQAVPPQAARAHAAAPGNFHSYA